MESIKARAEKVRALLTPIILDKISFFKNYKDSKFGTDKSVATNPEDKDAFFTRVSSFCQQNMAISWLLKPVELSPLQCAKYGWELLRKDIIQCVSCKNVVSAKLPDPKKGLKIYEECLADIVQSLKKAHIECCPWSSNPSPDSFLKFGEGSFESLFHDLSSRITSLLEIETLPSINDSFVTEDMKKANEKISESRQMEFSWPVFLLAVTGWHTESETSSDVKYLKCNRCLCKLATCTYKTGEDLISDDNKAEQISEEQDVSKPASPSAESEDSDESSGSSNKEEMENLDKNVSEQKPESPDEKRDDNSHQVENLNLENGEKRKAEEEDDAEVGNLTKKRKVLESFNPLEEHYFWCPWVQPCSSISNNCEFKSGWSYFVHLLISSEQLPKLSIDSQKYKDRWSGFKTICSIIQQWKSTN